MKRDLLTTAFERIRTRLVRTSAAEDYADDSLQDAFCRLWSRRADITSQEQAEGLLAVTARNIRIDSHRRQSRISRIDIEEAPPIADDDNAADDLSDTYMRVDRIISHALSERDRTILWLRDRDGKEFEEIASLLGLTEANVRMILSRARKTVRETYRKQISQNQ